ncbi:unnamed protein product [Tuber aestivum]|uniref:Uncharacterized protein n=1 Tax=Tuber aestivum TaxID=59557 RepID=A0A292PW76_9PEZI|nr:unnamed protein product [Tuber aestivum]
MTLVFVLGLASNSPRNLISRALKPRGSVGVMFDTTPGGNTSLG